MPENQTVLLHVENDIATITLNRPACLNAMNSELVAELSRVLDEMKHSTKTRVVILTGKGRAFCAGGDLTYLESLNDVVSAKSFIAKVGELVEKIMRLKQPVIAMVNGVAAGAGFNLALAADIIYCARSARFSQSFAKVGLVPDCAGMYLLPKAVGIHKAKELMFTADLIDAQTADRLGLINKIAEDAELSGETRALAEKLKHSAPIALAMIKKTLNGADALTLSDMLEQESALQTICMQTADHREGVAAFKEKRPPAFRGI